MTKRQLFHRSVAPLALCGVLPAWPARAQSLADIARKEEERRKATPAPAKVYTNKDLKEQVAPPPSDAAKPADEKTKDEAKDKDKDSSKDKDGAKDKDGKEPVKDRAYWSNRLKALEEKLLRDSNYLDAMQTRINALNTDFVNRDDPAQRAIVERDRQKALAEQGRLTKDVADDKKAIADLEEEARRAGIPPGWLR